MGRTLNSFLAAVLISMLCSCVSYEYLGDKYDPTETVRIYFNPSEIPSGMSKIGEATATLPDKYDFLVAEDAISEKLRDRAKKVGAEAILIVGNTRVVTATHTNKSYGDNYSSSSKTSFNSTSKVVQAFFYKKVN